MNSLQGRVVAITRSEKEAAEFSQLVRMEGGRAIALPTIEVVPAGPDAARKFIELLQTKRHDYCAFMSAQAVEALFGTASGAPDTETIRHALDATRIIAVGPKTKSRLEESGMHVDYVPAEFSSRGMTVMLSEMKPAGKKIVIPRSAAANDYAARSLQSLGMLVDEVLLYGIRTATTVSEAWKEFAPMLAGGAIDAVVFTSASSVSSFFEIIESQTRVELDKVTRVISIGPFTTEQLRKRGLECSEATEHTVRGTFEHAKAILQGK
ncbi:MAG TPA: uroporphyrinogen-III synthase [Nitrososphaera sp.]|nr:uroporphyrinogen-III synthase [Nitrososphaera sp.]